MEHSTAMAAYPASTRGSGGIGADGHGAAGFAGRFAKPVSAPPSALQHRGKTPLLSTQPQSDADFDDFRAGDNLGDTNSDAGAVDVCRSGGDYGDD